MKITEIFIISFGKLRNLKIIPAQGVNIIYGENEAGKTSIMAFILSMLYGIGKTEQRHLYEPWQGGRISGTMSFEHDGKEYFLDRHFGVTKSADKTELWCKTSGEMIDLSSKEEPGNFLFGINRETFVNTVFIGQAGTPIKGDNNEILARLMNLAASGDEMVSRTEISERLAEASAKLCSRRANAIIPSLEKQRMDMLEERAAILKRINESEELREDITRLMNRRDFLEREIVSMERECVVHNEIKKLSELEEIINRRESMENARQQYEMLNNTVFSDGGLTLEFIDDLRSLQDEYNTRKALISNEQEQLEAHTEKLREFNESSKREMNAIKRYKDQILEAISENKPLRERKHQLERKLENENQAIKTGKLGIQNVIIISAALTVILIMLGFINYLFFILAALVLCIAGAYVYTQISSQKFEGQSNSSLELQNVNEDIRRINRSMRHILDDMNVNSVDELEHAVNAFQTRLTQFTRVRKEKDELLDQLAKDRELLESTFQELKAKIEPYTGVESESEIATIISKLSRAQSDYVAFEAKYQTESEVFGSMLAGRDYERVLQEAENLRNKLSDVKVKRSDADLTEQIAEYRGELEAVKMELVEKQTTLNLQDTDPQDINKLNDNLKTLSERIDRYQFELSAIKEASSALDEAFESMQKDFGPMINFRTGKIISELTGKKYSSVAISEALTPSVIEPKGGSVRSCKSLSSGTIDQLYFALRLAITDVLPIHNMPVFLDDSFAQFDDKRTADAMSYLKRETEEEGMGQIILFTCHDRLLTIAKEVGLTDGIVRLR